MGTKIGIVQHRITQLRGAPRHHLQAHSRDWQWQAHGLPIDRRSVSHALMPQPPKLSKQLGRDRRRQNPVTVRPGAGYRAAPASRGQRQASVARRLAAEPPRCADCAQPWKSIQHRHDLRHRAHAFLTWAEITASASAAWQDDPIRRHSTLGKLTMPWLTAFEKSAKNCSESFLAVPVINRWPSWAIFPPICTSTT
jgi:hypothetical protein